MNDEGKCGMGGTWVRKRSTPIKGTVAAQVHKPHSTTLSDARRIDCAGLAYHVF